MKTFYTLLLAFGLCLTSHAQSNIVSNYSQITASEKIIVDNFFSGDNNKLLIQEGFVPKYLGNQLNDKIVEIVGLNSLQLDIFEANEDHFSNSKAIVFNVKNINDITANLDLSTANKLQYVLFKTQVDIPVNTIQQWVSNLNLPTTVKVVYQKIVLN